MSALPALAQALPDAPAKSGKGEEPLMSRLASRQSNEIVIAFAGPIGCGIQAVVNATKQNLKLLAYERIEVIKLSHFLENVLQEGRVKPLERPTGCSDRLFRYRRLQEAGRDIRRVSKNKHILAEYAVQQIVLDRHKNQPAAAAGDAELGALGVRSPSLQPHSHTRRKLH